VSFHSILAKKIYYIKTDRVGRDFNHNLVHPIAKDGSYIPKGHFMTYYFKRKEEKIAAFIFKEKICISRDSVHFGNILQRK